MKIYPDTKIYILCPSNFRSGGPESLHQLASQLISFGAETYMFYWSLAGGNFDRNNPVDDIYKKYHVPYTYEIENSSRNIFIMPEPASKIGLSVAEKCRKIIWWMSVDNYLMSIIKTISGFLENPLVNPVPKFFFFNKANDDIEHWSKSEYSRLFLELNGISADKIQHVETYMNQTFFEHAEQINLAEKKNFVAYNPIKGFEVTKHFIALAPEIDWRPIKNMTPAQVQNLLAQAKVYIDFGKHPGRDRLPREATLSRCVVIVGKRGAAANDVDINIPAEFKFSFDDSPYQVVEKIREAFDNFERELDKQRAFRQRVCDDRKNFPMEVAAAFELKKFPPPSVAFVQGVGEKSFILAEEFFKSREFTPSFIVDDMLSAAEISDELILREQNRNYLRVRKNFIEIISREDAKFLYGEGRIKKFALLEPKDEELAELKDFYEADDADILICEM